MNAGQRSNALGNERVFRILGYGLVFMLMACTVLTMSILINTLFPDWHSGLIAGAALFVVVDRLYTYRQMKSLALLSPEWAITIAAQWIVIMLVIRLLLSYAGGPGSLREDLSLFARGYFEKFFSAEFVIALLLAFLVWHITRLFLDLIDEIGLNQSAALHEEAPPDQRNDVPAHQRMVNLIFSLGIVLVILTAMTRMNLRTIISNTEGMPGLEFSRFSGAEAGALLYFVFGLALLSLSRLMSLQTRWNRLRIPISSKNLTRQWGMYSLLFLLALALVVGLLPSGDSVGFFSLVGTLFGFLFAVLLFLTQIVIGFILLLISLPFLLLGKAPPMLANATVLPPPVLPSRPLAIAAGNETWALVRSTVLWGLLVLLIVFALVQFARQHKNILPALRRSRIVNWLVLTWQWLHANVDKTSGSLSRMLGQGLRGMRSRLGGRRVSSPGGLISLRSLDPRRKVFFFYHAMIRRGGEQEVARRPSQTPSEYAAVLEKTLPAAGEDIDSMTEAFIKARYSRHEVNSRDADAVKDAWERVRRVLQSKSRDKKAGR